MKKFVVALVALMFLLVVACEDSGPVQAEGVVKNPEVAEFENPDYDGDTYVIRHKETGVCYLVYYDNYGCGLTVMINQDGSPYVWEVTPDE